MFRKILSIFGFELVALFLTLIIGVVFMYSPTVSASNEYETITATKIHSWGLVYVYEIVDNETGVCYLYVDGHEKGGLTPMYQPNGMPKVKR